MSSGLPDVSHSEHNFKDGKMYARSTKLEDRGRDGSPRVASERIALSFTPAAHYAGAHGMECAAAPPTSLQGGWTLSIGQRSLTSNTRCRAGTAATSPCLSSASLAAWMDSDHSPRTASEWISAQPAWDPARRRNRIRDGTPGPASSACWHSAQISTRRL